MTGILSVLVVMNGLYFFNVIPPIPLTLREAGIYHSVERSQDGYTVIAESRSFFEKVIPGETMHVEPGDDLYAFTSIFAPAELDTVIVHEWQFYNNETRKWQTVAKPSFTISGGRENGYRGYSFTTQSKPGRWRVDVETKRGQVIGRVRFKVKEATNQVKFIQETK